ncbi:MAG: iron receptor [Desulfovibrionaceae bacterium]
MQLAPKQRNAIKRECRAQVHEMMLEQYQLYDAIWWDRIRIDSALLAHGKEIVNDINRLMPNLLTHDPCISPLDIVASRYGFEDTSDLIDFLLAYKPRGPVKERFYTQLLQEYTQQTPAVDAVPF